MAKKTETPAPAEPRTGTHIVAYESKDAPACHRWIAFAYRFGLPTEEGREQFSRLLVHCIGSTEEIVRARATKFMLDEQEKSARRKATAEKNARRMREMAKERREQLREEAAAA
jgi:hypothetical protein